MMMVHRMTTAALEAEATKLDGHECVYFGDYCVDCTRAEKIERELDARGLWDHDDARVRESVGNYR